MFRLRQTELVYLFLTGIDQIKGGAYTHVCLDKKLFQMIPGIVFNFSRSKESSDLAEGYIPCFREALAPFIKYICHIAIISSAFLCSRQLTAAGIDLDPALQADSRLHTAFH